MLNTVWTFIKEYEPILSIIGFVITLWTFLQVSNIKKAQVKYDELVEIESIIALLSRISAYFTSNLIQSDANVSALQQDIQRAIGKIEGVKTALFKKPNKKDSIDSIQFIKEGYYSDPFLAAKIKETKMVLRIFAKRNLRLSNMDHLQSIGKLLSESRNCTVELIAMSPESSEEALYEVNKTIPIPAPSVEKLKEELIENRRKIIEFKESLDASQKNRFFYYEFLGVPPFHCIQVDDSLYFGLVNYYKAPNEYGVVENRPCVKLDLKSVDFAQRIKKQIETFIEECNQEGRVY